MNTCTGTVCINRASTLHPTSTARVLYHKHLMHNVASMSDQLLQYPSQSFPRIFPFEHFHCNLLDKIQLNAQPQYNLAYACNSNRWWALQLILNWLCHCKTPSLLESYAHIHICQLTWMLLLPSMIMRSSLFQFVISTCLNKACFNHQHCIDMHHIGKLACCNADAIQINISIILAVQHWYASVPVRIGWWGDHAYGMVMVLADGETTPMVR